MTTYTGKCHCGQTEWTTKLDGEAHILWYVRKQSTLPPLRRVLQLLLIEHSPQAQVIAQKIS